MKKGDVVKLVSGQEGVAFTPGRDYEIICGKDDLSELYGEVDTEKSFTAIDDFGDEQYCTYPSCAHGEWEIQQ